MRVVVGSSENLLFIFCIRQVRSAGQIGLLRGDEKHCATIGKRLSHFGIRNGRALVNSLNFPAGDTDFSDRNYFAVHQSGGRVLLVEDNNDVAAVAADHLEQCGCVVVRVESATSAINVLEKILKST